MCTVEPCWCPFILFYWFLAPCLCLLFPPKGCLPPKDPAVNFFFSIFRATAQAQLLLETPGTSQPQDSFPSPVKGALPVSPRSGKSLPVQIARGWLLPLSFFSYLTPFLL